MERWDNGELLMDIKNHYKTKNIIQARARRINVELEKKDNLSSFQKYIIRSGTLSDRLGSWMILFQNRPLSRLSLLRKLLKWTQRKNYRERELAIRNLIIIFTSDVMPNRELISLKKRNMFEELTDKQIVFWNFESELKQIYKNFILILKKGTSDYIDWFRIKSINWITTLLEYNLENNIFSLKILIFKLGDKEKKVASMSLRCLQRLIKKYYKIKIIIIREISSLFEHSSIRLKKNSLVILSEFRYFDIKEDEENATLCMNIFLNFLKENLIKTNLSGRILKILFIGMRRALHYCKIKSEIFEVKLCFFYRIIYKLSLTISIHTLLIIHHIEEVKKNLSNRFYRALYQLLHHANILQCKKPYQLLHLIYITLKNDKNIHRITAFIKRLFQIVFHQNSPFACGVFMLISEICKKHKYISQLFNLNNFTARKKMPFKKNIKLNMILVGYDLKKKDPLYSQAMQSGLWEGSLLALHYHPSVKNWFNKLIKGNRVQYTGDPILDFATRSFLGHYL